MRILRLIVLITRGFGNSEEVSFVRFRRHRFGRRRFHRGFRRRRFGGRRRFGRRLRIGFRM